MDDDLMKIKDKLELINGKIRLISFATIDPSVNLALGTVETDIEVVLGMIDAMITPKQSS